MLAICKLPLRIFFLEFFSYIKNCNFEPFCHVIKMVLIRRGHIRVIGSIPSLLPIFLSLPLNYLPYVIGVNWLNDCDGSGLLGGGFNPLNDFTGQSISYSLTRD